MKLSPFLGFNLHMKHLHRLALLALVAATSLGTAAAQTSTTTPPPPPADGGTPPPPPKGDFKERGEKRMKELTEKLGLTQAQQDQIKAIMDDSLKQMKAIHDDTTLSKEDMMGKMKDLHEATHEKIRAILTPDQQKTFDEMKEGHRPPPPAQS